MTTFVGYLLLFVVVGIAFIFVHLLAGLLLRPVKPDPEKLTVYECGEPTIGSAWVQFDLRYYVVALLFVIFDVEVAFFFPWAIVFGQANTLANPDTPPEQQTAIIKQLEGPNSTTQPGPEVQQAAHSFAWIAFWDIIVFFGVLLVGFAYLWRRGDLAWVRSTAAEKVPEAAVERRELVGAGRS